MWFIASFIDSTTFIERIAILSIKVVESMNDAINHIQKYGSHHTDSIVSEDLKKVDAFFKQVDSSSVMHNLPTCWADGFEYGLGHIQIHLPNKWVNYASLSWNRLA